jgi:predicted DCC family thiol-disulfide oxidoreductase YuxK
MAAGAVILFSRKLQSISLEEMQTMVFCSIVAFQWFNALNSRWLLIGLALAIVLKMLVVYVPLL